MFSEQEVTFLDTVVKRYCGPLPPMRNTTLTLMDAAYYAAKDQGVPVSADESEQAAFFKTFMGGLMFKPEAKAYMEAGIVALIEQRENRSREQVKRCKENLEKAREQVEAIYQAAINVQALTANLNVIGVFPVFAAGSPELDVLKEIRHRI